MSDFFRPLNRAELARVFGNSPEMIRAFESLQTLVGGKIQTDIAALQQSVAAIDGEIDSLSESVAALQTKSDDFELDILARVSIVITTAAAYTRAAVESADVSALLARQSTQLRELQKRVDALESAP